MQPAPSSARSPRTAKVWCWQSSISTNWPKCARRGGYSATAAPTSTPPSATTGDATSLSRHGEGNLLRTPEPGGAANTARIAKGVFYDTRLGLRHEGIALGAPRKFVREIGKI